MTGPVIPATTSQNLGSNITYSGSEDDRAAVTMEELRRLLADVFALHLKTKAFHWHVNGPHFRDYHLLFDDQATQLFAMTDPIAERLRKLSADAIWSISEVTRLQRLEDCRLEKRSAELMLRELLDDNKRLGESLRKTHALCDRQADVATASLLENWIDETDERIWYLSETLR
ncbi:Dps family protein [Novipirellula sp.]|uniref:Dps family protein n=1 Tax=Novipirellula sp. TaxID=2795430 RepID=UPI003569D217